LIALGMTLVLGSLATAIAVAAGGEADSPPSTLAATLIQDIVLVATAVALARRVSRPDPADFGLRSAPLRRSAAFTALALAGFYLLSAAYAALVNPEGEQDTLERFGADRGTTYLAVSAVMVIVLAPVVEEFFFRGFMYRSLRNRLSPLVASLCIGVVFGAIHYSGPETLDLLPVLALLGAMFCWLYEVTGSLYPAIAVHVVNNSLAFVVAAEGSLAPALAVVLGGAMLVACVAVPGSAK
jgi:membrane protease YdiL (CAAX protease family)